MLSAGLVPAGLIVVLFLLALAGVIGFPSMVLLGALTVFKNLERLGLTHHFAYSERRQLDRLLTGAILGGMGIYAFLCRGISLSGLICTAFLTGFYIREFRMDGRRLTIGATLVIAFMWSALAWRFLFPQPVSIICGDNGCFVWWAVRSH